MSLEPLTHACLPGHVLLGLALLGLVTACEDPAAKPAADAGPAPDAAVALAPLIESPKARVRFKGPRWAADLAAGLDLPRDTLCQELGLADCVDTVHHIALGGVEPYRLGVRLPLPIAPVTAAIAAERVALSACVRRIDQDLAAPADAWLFGPLADQAALPDAATLRPLAAGLAPRILQRDATPAEIDALLAFADTVRADPETATPARDWAILSCFAVASSLESLFY